MAFKNGRAKDTACLGLHEGHLQEFWKNADAENELLCSDGNRHRERVGIEVP